MYKTVHTGANIQVGGINEGFSRVGYQLPAEACDAKLERNPIRRQTPTAGAI
jgi:hypothetical protein